MMPTEMEHRVANAILSTLNADGPIDDRFNCLSEPNRAKVLAQAQAAIKAMREPTEAMIEAGSSAIAEVHQCEIRGEEGGRQILIDSPVLRHAYYSYALDGFAAMIDSALSP